MGLRCFEKRAVLHPDQQFGPQAIAPKMGVGVEQVLPGVLVEISQGGGHAIHDQVHVQFRGDVHESPVALVFEHGVGAVFVVDDKDVLPPVVVVVPPQALKTQPEMHVYA